MTQTAGARRSNPFTAVLEPLGPLTIDVDSPGPHQPPPSSHKCRPDKVAVTLQSS